MQHTGKNPQSFRFLWLWTALQVSNINGQGCLKVAKSLSGTTQLSFKKNQSSQSSSPHHVYIFVFSRQQEGAWSLIILISTHWVFTGYYNRNDHFLSDYREHVLVPFQHFSSAPAPAVLYHCTNSITYSWLCDWQAAILWWCFTIKNNKTIYLNHSLDSRDITCVGLRWIILTRKHNHEPHILSGLHAL